MSDSTEDERPEGRAKRHPIGVAARRTGLSTHVLRAWEQRYGAVEPVRTGGGQRLYSEEDIARLRLLRRATERGHPIGRIAALPLAEIAALLQADDAVVPDDRGGSAASVPADTAARAGGVLTEAFAAAQELDAPRLSAALMRAVVQMSPDTFVEDVAVPLLHRVGSRWAEGRLRPAEEHVVSVAVRRVLGWLMEQIGARADAPVIVLTTLQGEQHELGAMLAGVLAAVEGWRAVYLGPNLPPEEIAAAVHTTGARAVALSMVLLNGDDAAHQLQGIRERLPAEVVLIIGGAAARRVAAVRAPSGAMQLEDFTEFRRELRALARRTAQARSVE